MTGNAYFKEMVRIGREWQKAHEAHKALQERIIAVPGWESPEMKARYAEEERVFSPKQHSIWEQYVLRGKSAILPRFLPLDETNETDAA